MTLTFDKDPARVAAAIRKIAWCACEVNECGGTRANPCVEHMKAAEDFFRAVTTPPDAECRGRG